MDEDIVYSDVKTLVLNKVLVLKTVQVIRDTCNYLGQSYPKTHEVNWNDTAVWVDMIKDPTGIFQFEGKQICSR